MSDNKGSKKYYWLKLKKDFFKRHDIKIIESMKNGKDYVLFYLKLLVESIDHEGRLRFSDAIPYNLDMLSTITDTNVDTVRTALEIFQKLQLVEIMDDGTYHMKKVKTMIGSETGWAAKKRKQRQNKGEKGDIVLIESPNCPTEIETDIELEIEKDIEKDIDTTNESAVSNDKTYRKVQHLTLTITEFERLNAEYNKTDIDEVLDDMENYSKLKNYKSANLTARKWLKKRNAPKKNTEKKIEPWEEDFIPYE